MRGRRLGFTVITLVALLSAFGVVTGAPLGSGDVQGQHSTPAATGANATAVTGDTERVSAAAPTPTQDVTVAGFNSAFPNCPAQEVAELGTFFTGDIGPTDSDFHIDNSNDVSNPPTGECFLRTNSESAQINSVPGQQSGDLNYYPERGDEIRFQHYINNIGTVAGINFPFSGGSDLEFRFGVQNSQNYYYLSLAANNEPFELRLGKVVNGNRQVLDTSGLAITEATFQPVEIRWGTGNTPGRIEAEFAGQNTVSATDTTFDEGGIGFNRSGTTGDVPESVPLIGGTNVLSFANLVDRVTAEVVPAEFRVNVTSVDDPVAPGQTAQVTAEVRNVGGRDQTESVEFRVGGELVSTKTVSLESGYAGNYDSTTVTFDYTSSGADAPSVPFDVLATDSNNQATGQIEVLEPASFDVSITGSTDAVAGQDISVTASITNTGEVGDTGTVTLDVLGLGSTSTTVSLGSGQSTTETLSVATTQGDAGTYTATVDSGSDSASTTVTVSSQANFDVGVASTNTPIEGESLTVTAEVTNTGDVADTQTITLDIPGLGSDSPSVSLAGGQSTTETLAVSTSANDAGEYTATVSSADDTASTPVAVLTEEQGSGVFVADVTTTNSPVREGETLDLIANITNTGGVTDTQTVNLSVNGVGDDSTTLTLAPGESTLETFLIATASGENGSYTATLRTDDDVTSVPVEIRALSNLAVDITDAPTTVAGNNLAVTATVTNTGDLTDLQDITLSVPGLGTRSTSVLLNGSDLTTVRFTLSTSFSDAGSYTATVSSADDSVTRPVSVVEPEKFAVQVTDTTDPVVGGPLTVTAAVTNIGEISGTQTVTLDAQGLGTTSTQVSLDPGDAATTTLSLETGPGDVGNYTATVSTANDTASTPVTVFDPANFAVTIAGTNQPVEGNPVSVTAEVTNTGGVDDTQSVTLDVPGLGTNSTTVTLDPGESTTRTFTVSTAVGDGREYVLTVATENETATASVEVLELPTFAVDITSVTDPVEGNPLSVTATVTNEGDLAGTQTIELNVSGLGINSTSLSLSPGQSVSRTLSVATSPGDAGRYPLRVTSANETDGTIATVRAPATFDVAVTDTTGPVEGDPLSVTAEVTNTGDLAGTQAVTLDVPGLGNTSTSLQLDSNTSTTTTLSVDTANGDAGSYTATVSTANDTVSTPVTVRDQASFNVELVGATEPVEGDALTVTAGVTNTGDIAGTQTVTLSVPGLGTTTTTPSLNGSESETVTLSLTTTAGENGTYTATVTTANDSASQSVTVLADAAFAVSVTDTTDPVAGEPLTLTATVTNTGDTAATQTVTASVPGLGSNSTELTLGGSSSTSETFSFATGPGDTGSYTATVSSANDSASTAVSVLAPATLEVGITSAPDVIEGETLSVTADVTNTGDVVDAQTVTLSVPGLGTASTTRLLGPGNTSTATLSVPTSRGDVGNYTVTVSTADDNASRQVSVLDTGSVIVDITNVTERKAGNPLTVNASADNTGTTATTQEITLDIPGLATTTSTLTLGANESVVETFTVETNTTDGGAYTATVTSANDSDSTTVEVLEEAFLDAEIVDRTQPVAGNPLNATVRVTNRGDFSGSTFLSVVVFGESTSEFVSLSGGESSNKTVSFATTADDVGSYTLTATGVDDEDSVPVSVLAADTLGVQVEAVATPLEGERLSVTAALTNTGSAQKAQTLTLDVPGLGTNTTTVTVGAGNTTTRTLSLATTDGDVGSYTATLSTADDSASRSVSVLGPANFAVSLTGTNEPLAGQPLSVTAEVTNTGNFTTTQALSLEVPGLGTATTGVQLGGGEMTTATLSLATADGDGGTYTATVSTANDTATRSVIVLRPPSFAVDIAERTAPVAGQDLTVTATITNTGDRGERLPVTLDVGGLGTDSAEIPLLKNGSSQDSTNETFSVPTAPGDAGSYTAAVSSPNATDTAPVSVLAPANLTVAVADTSEPAAGGELSVTATVTNTGDVKTTQTLALDVPGLGSNSTELTLGGGATTTETLVVDTTRSDAGNYTATVTVDNDSATTPIAVPAPANYTLSVDDSTEPAAGDLLSVTTTLTNTGEVTGTQTVTLSVPDVGTIAKTVTLPGGASDTETFSLRTTPDDAGTYTATIATANATTTTTVSVLAPANLSISVADVGTALAGGTLPVTVDVTNTGEVTGTQTVTLSVPGLGTDTTPVTVSGGATTTRTLSLSLGDSAAGSYTATVTTADDTAATPVTVQDPATFAVSITAASNATAGETLSVTAELTNTGDLAGTQAVTLGVPGVGTDTAAVSLAAGNSTTQTFTLATGDGDSGEYTATVTTANDSASAPVTVVAPPSFDVTTVDAPDTVAGENLSVTVDVTNTGDVAGTQTLTLDVPGLGTTTAAVSLGSTTTVTRTLSVGTTVGENGTYTATVTSANDTASQSVTVLEPAALAVDITSSTDALEGESLTVEASIENTGGVSTTQTVTLSAPGLGSTLTTVTLAPGTSTTETLSLATADGDGGNYTATVSTSGTSDSTGVQVLAPATFDVSVASAGTVVAGTNLTVTANVTNAGDFAGTQTVAVEVPGLGTRSRTVTLSAGATTTETVSFTTDVADIGSYTVTATSANDTASASTAVLSSASFAVEITGTTEPIQGELLTATVNVTNTGGVSGTRTVSLSAGPLGSNATTLSLAGGESRTVELGVPTAAGNFGTYSMTVSTPGVQATQQATVLLPPITTNPPTDVDGDGRYEDVRGSGSATLLDVQLLFSNLDDPVVENNPSAFNFQTDFDRITALDVQALFNELPG